MTEVVHSPASQITIVLNSTVSKTVYESEFLKTVLFAFDAGLFEHFSQGFFDSFFYQRFEFVVRERDGGGGFRFRFHWSKS